MTAVRHAAIVVTIAAACASPAAAQAVFSGRVLGPDGLPIEGTTIYLTNIATTAQLEFPASADGRFEFSGLAPGEYRVTAMNPGIMPFTVTLAANEPVRQEITIPFGPFMASWQVLPGSGQNLGGGRGSVAPNFRCADRGRPLCGPESIVQEFERDEAERLKNPVLGPRMVRMPGERYPQALVDAGIEGDVRMETRIGTDGALIGLRVVSADHPALGEAALASARSALWEPARLRGVTVEVPMTIDVQYRLQPLSPPRPGTIPQSIVRAPMARVQQAPAPDAAAPAFEVASVKPNTSGEPRVTVQTLPGGRFNAVNQTLRGLIRFAYGLQDFQLIGPDWIDTARFDVLASAGRMPMPGEIQQMMRALLADRFKLVMRTEAREVAMYELALARDDGRLGPQLSPADPMGCRQMTPGQPPFGPGLLQGCGTYFGGNGRMTAKSVTMDSLAGNLSGPAGRRVLNRTGLMGVFDVQLEFSGGAGGGLGPLPPQPGAPPPPPDERPALTTAVQEQLGLRLNNIRGPIEVQVIESVSQPTPD